MEEKEEESAAARRLELPGGGLYARTPEFDRALCTSHALPPVLNRALCES